MKDISQSDLENNLPLVMRKDFKREVFIKDFKIGGKELAIMAGPCTVESLSQVMDIARHVKKAGANILRGGVFKPLTFPYGDPLGQPDADSKEPPRDRKIVLKKKELFEAAEKRFRYLREASEAFDLPVVSEILYADSVELMYPYVDMFQIGYRHMFNMDLIDALCKTDKPILIKRHYGESLRSLLGVAEHFEARGKHNFAFCERGVAVPHTHNAVSRAVLDLQAVPALKEFAPSVPVMIDPSHSTFKRNYVATMARAGIAAGADGILIDVHPTPEKAWVDPLQALDYEAFANLVDQLKQIKEVVKE